MGVGVPRIGHRREMVEGRRSVLRAGERVVAVHVEGRGGREWEG